MYLLQLVDFFCHFVNVSVVSFPHCVHLEERRGRREAERRGREEEERDGVLTSFLVL